MNNTFQGGRVKIANDILAKVTREAALEVVNVKEVLNGADFVNYEKFTTTDSNKGLKIAAKDGLVRIDIRLIAGSNNNIAMTAEEVQKNITEKMEIITGLAVVEVNVFVESILG